ncbi:MAG: hypothetical protein Q8R30_00645 [bacterium]|nr:hypothetical protein [bacterium]
MRCFTFRDMRLSGGVKVSEDDRGLHVLLGAFRFACRVNVDRQNPPWIEEEDLCHEADIKSTRSGQWFLSGATAATKGDFLLLVSTENSLLNHAPSAKHGVAGRWQIAAGNPKTLCAGQGKKPRLRDGRLLFGSPVGKRFWEGFVVLRDGDAIEVVMEGLSKMMACRFKIFARGDELVVGQLSDA